MLKIGVIIMIKIKDFHLYDDTIKGPICILKIYHAKANDKKIIVVCDDVSYKGWVYHENVLLANLHLYEILTSSISLSDYVQSKLNDLDIEL